MNTEASRIKVVVGIIQNEEGRFLVSKRPDHSHSGGYWEFPGGKVEPGETNLKALVRELKEEVNLEIISAVSFLRFDYENPHRLIDLDIWRVTDFRGEASGLEGQPVQWLFLGELHSIGMLPANERVLQALEDVI